MIDADVEELAHQRFVQTRWPWQPAPALWQGTGSGMRQGDMVGQRLGHRGFPLERHFQIVVEMELAEPLRPFRG